MRSRILFLTLALASAAAGGSPPARHVEAVRSVSAATVPAKSAAGGVDPRAGGFEIGLGEWALVPEARAIRPGRVTFVIRNRGKVTHGFELKVRRHGDEDEGEREVESAQLRPGRSTRVTLNLRPGLYDLECFVGHHDDLGMRGVLEVREDAPLVVPAPASTRSSVAIQGFAFKPAMLRTTTGTVVTWRNLDPTPHTASARQFSSPQIGKGATYRRRFAQPGTYSYLCALHPGMRGKVVVAAKGAP